MVIMEMVKEFTSAEALPFQPSPSLEDQYTRPFASGRDGEKALRLRMCHMDSL